jgi:uncharacterized membrane protein
MLTTRTRRFTTLETGLLFATCMVSSGFAHDHGFTTIDVPGASSTQALGINPKGNIVGSYLDAAGLHGFLLSKGAFTTIDVPGASSTQALGINPKGNVVGAYGNATGTHGFLLRRREGDDDDGDDDAFTTIDVPGASFTQALAINPRGDVVGVYGNATGTHGFLLRKREGDDDGDNDAFTTIDVPGASFTEAFGINPKGTVVGVYSNAIGTHGFLLRKRERHDDGDDDALTTIDVPGASFTGAFGINPKGHVVGIYSNATGTHGFLLRMRERDDAGGERGDAEHCETRHGSELP